MALVVRVPREELLAAARHLPGEHELREMAVPSYCHRLPPIRWLFWRRLETALRLAALRPGESALEFGVGSGILLPTLAERCTRVFATDLFLGPARALAQARGLSTVRFVEDPARVHEGITPPVECVFALDVLEHVEDLPHTLRSLAACLAPGGRLIVSGPTETFSYRVGRAIAGFKNEYHHRNVRDILAAALAGGWSLEVRAREPFFPLPRAFEIYRLVRRAEGA
ncbi:MAG: class I SAM-dependent methyltransferase [Planctomycetes bacterium]|nr:class I SAM-dependent methyltransferase [Planctomycetota bacterium]